MAANTLPKKTKITVICTGQDQECLFEALQYLLNRQKEQETTPQRKEA